MSDPISFFPNKIQNAEVPVVLVVQFASRHSCIADRLPNQDRRLATGSDKKSHKNAADASRPARRNDWLQPIVTNANLFSSVVADIALRLGRVNKLEIQHETPRFRSKGKLSTKINDKNILNRRYANLPARFAFFFPSNALWLSPG